MTKGYLFLLATSFFFGTFEVVSKLITGIDAIQLNFLRFLIGSLVLLPFALLEIKKNQMVIPKKDLAYLLILGICFVPLGTTLFQVAIQKTTASLTSFIFSSNPIFIAFFAFLFRHEKPNKYVLISIFISIIGLFMIINPFAGSFNNDAFYAIAGTFIFSVFIILMRSFTATYGHVVTFALVILFGTSIMLAGMLALGMPILQGLLSGSNIILLLYMGIFCSGLAYVAYFRGMELTTTNKGSIIYFLKPLLGTLLAVGILNENISGIFVAGSLLLLSGSVIMLYGKEKEETALPVKAI